MIDKNTGQTEMRFSDEELHDFHSEFKEHVEHEKELQNQLAQCLNRNKTALENLTKIVEKQSSETRDLIEAWTAVQGTVRFGSALGKFIKWASGLAIVGWIFVELTKHIDKIK